MPTSEAMQLWESNTLGRLECPPLMALNYGKSKALGCRECPPLIPCNHGKSNAWVVMNAHH